MPVYLELALNWNFLGPENGKPALVIQPDHFSKHPCVTILPVTTEIRPIETIRVAVEPSE